jgi:type IV pilus assembly protein PilV
MKTRTLPRSRRGSALTHSRHGSALPHSQRGSALLEALFAILIFSIGLLALVALQAVSIKNSIDAKYRSDASYVANQIIAQMWVDRSNLDNYVRNETGAVCNFAGAAGNANVTAWVAQVAGLLPGSAANGTQIQVTTPAGTSTRLVKVTVCWQGPQEATPHNFAVTARINL